VKPDVEKALRFYEKTLDAAVRMHGEDWRSEWYREKVDRIRELSEKVSLSDEEKMFITCRLAVSQGFTEKK
jgi:hypothetical protein